MEARPTLEIGPTEPAFAILEMKRSCAPSKQSQPVALKSDHMTELFPDQIGVFEVVMLADQFVPSENFGWIHQASDFQFIQNGGLLALGQAKWF